MKYLTWFIASFFAFFQFYLQAAVGIFGAEWMKDFHLDKFELSNLSAAFFYTYACLQIPAGMMFDRFQLRYIMIIAAFILTSGIFILAYTNSYPIALFARLLMGIGSSFAFIGLLQICATYFSPKRFAIMLGISEGATMLGMTIGIILLSWLNDHLSWRIIIAGSGLITFSLMLAMYYFIRPSSSMNSSNISQSHSAVSIYQCIKILICNRQLLLGSFYGFCMFSIINAFASLWGIPFLMTIYMFSQQMAANMVAVIFIGFAIGGPISGWLSKLFNTQRTILIGASALGTMTMSVIIFFPSIPKTSLFILFFLSGAFCSAYIQCFAVIKEAVHPSVRATALAATNMIVMLGAPVFQLSIGSLLQNHFFGLTNQIVSIYRFSLALLPMGMFVAFLLSFRIKDTVNEEERGVIQNL